MYLYLLIGKHLVGIVEVKKPGNDVLLEPTALGELLDQMLLVEGFYGMGPVFGILTTGEEWDESWFPGDTDILASGGQSEGSYSTPLKSTSSDSTESKAISGHSPSGGTPSQLSGKFHVKEITEYAELLDDNAEIYIDMERVLHTTPVVYIHSDYYLVLQLLCTAFKQMENT